MKFREWEGKSSQTVLRVLLRLILTGGKRALPPIRRFLVQSMVAQRSVCLAEPSLPSAPSGGRLREADTRPCLVVSSGSVAVADWTAHACSLAEIVGPAAGGATRMGRNRARRLGCAAPPGRAIAPGRGRLRPRAAQACAWSYDRIANAQQLSRPNATFAPEFMFSGVLRLSKYRKYPVNSPLLSTMQYQSAHHNSLKSKDLNFQLASTLYPDLQKQAPIVPANSQVHLLRFDYT